MEKIHVNTSDPEVRKIIIAQYHRFGERWVENQYEITGRQVRRWIVREGMPEGLMPRFHARGMKPTLTHGEVRKLERALLRDPYLTNADLARMVGNRVSAQSAGSYIAKSDYDFVWKLEQFDEEPTFTERHVEEGNEFYKLVRHIPHANRIYVDETWIVPSVRRRKGRFPSGTAPWTPKNRKYPRKVVLCAIRQDRWLHDGIVLNKESLSTADFNDYVINTLAPLVEDGDVVLWDRLGKSGRAINPTAQHWSPTARAAIVARGARVQFLPPYGKHFDPIEMLFGEAKRAYDKKLAEKLRRRQPSEIPLPTMQRLWIEAEDSISLESFTRAWAERADGQEFFRVCREKGLVEDDK